MDDTFSCPSCRAVLRRSAALHAGDLIACPGCGYEFTVPTGGDGVAAAPAPRPPELVGVRRKADLTGFFTPDVSAWVSMGFSRVSDFLMPFFFFALILLVLNLAANFIPFVGPLAAWLLGLVLAPGSLLAALRVLRREPWEFGNFFDGLNHFGPLLLAGLVQTVAAVVAAVPLALACVAAAWRPGLGLSETLNRTLTWDPYRGPEGTLFLFAGFVVSAAVALYLQGRLMFTAPLIAEEKKSAADALVASWRLTRGKGLAMFGFQGILFILWFGGVLMCGVGALFTAPLAVLTWAAAYLHATGQVARSDALPPAPEAPDPAPPVTDITDRPQA